MFSSFLENIFEQSNCKLFGTLFESCGIAVVDNDTLNLQTYKRSSEIFTFLGFQ